MLMIKFKIFCSQNPVLELIFFLKLCHQHLILDIGFTHFGLPLWGFKNIYIGFILFFDNIKIYTQKENY